MQLHDIGNFCFCDSTRHFYEAAVLWQLDLDNDHSSHGFNVPSQYSA